MSAVIYISQNIIFFKWDGKQRALKIIEYSNKSWAEFRFSWLDGRNVSVTKFESNSQYLLVAGGKIIMRTI